MDRVESRTGVVPVAYLENSAHLKTLLGNADAATKAKLRRMPYWLALYSHESGAGPLFPAPGDPKGLLNQYRVWSDWTLWQYGGVDWEHGRSRPKVYNHGSYHFSPYFGNLDRPVERNIFNGSRAAARGLLETPRVAAEMIGLFESACAADAQIFSQIPPTGIPKTTMSTTDQNIALIKDLYDRFGRGDVDGILANLTDDVVWEEPAHPLIPYGGKRQGKAAVGQFFSQLSAVEVERFEPREFIASGDRVIVLGGWAGKVTGTGKHFASDWAMAWTVVNGKVTGYRAYEDFAVIAAAFQK